MCLAEKIEVTTLKAPDIDAARELVATYVRSLGIDLSFQDIDEELADFPAKYAEPKGTFLVAKDGARVVGCVGLRRLEDGVCEMKRLFVRDECKGRGIGRDLVEAVIGEARQKGYKRMRLDTLWHMKAAQMLYLSFGFYEIGSYVHNPIAGTVFMEKVLGNH